MGHHDMTDLEWDFIHCVLPTDVRGVARVDDRRVLNGIFFILRTGTPWRDLPGRYGNYSTVYNRFNRWRYKGVWDRIMDAVVDAHNGDVVMLDSTTVRVHHAAAGAQKKVQTPS